MARCLLLQAAVLLLLFHFDYVKSQPNQLYKDGDIIIGAVLSVHEANATRRADFDLINACGELIPSRVLLVSQFRRTIAAINANPNLLPGVKLGYNIIDACSLSTVATVRAMQWATTKVTATMMRSGSNLQPKPVSVVIGTEYSRISAPLNMLLQQFKIPQIDFGATSADLSDKRRYRLYTRTNPSDIYQARAMASLAYSLGWQCVHVVYSQGMYGEFGVHDLKMSLAKLGICTASESQAPIQNADHLSSDFDRIVANIERTPSAAAIICFCEAATIRGLMVSLQKSRDFALNMGEFRPRFVIVAGDAWGTSTEIPDGLTDVAAGSITLRLAAPEVADFNEWFASQTPFQPDADPWFLEFWEQKFRCTFRADDPDGRQRCKLDPSIRLKVSDVPSADSLGLLTTSIYAAAYGLQDYLSKACSAVGEERCTPDKLMSITQRGAKLYPSIANISFELSKDFNNAGQWFQFDENGDGPARYEYHVYRRLDDGATPFGYVKIGEWSNQSPTASLYQGAKSLITWPDSNALVTSVCACRAEPIVNDANGCLGGGPGQTRITPRMRTSTKRVPTKPSPKPASEVNNIPYVLPGFDYQIPGNSNNVKKSEQEQDSSAANDQNTFLILDSPSTSTTTEPPPVSTTPELSTSTSTRVTTRSTTSSTTSTTSTTTMIPLTNTPPPESSNMILNNGDIFQPDWVPVGYSHVGMHCKGGTLIETGSTYESVDECVTECDLTPDCYGITITSTGKIPCYPKAASCKFSNSVENVDNKKWTFIVKKSFASGPTLTSKKPHVTQQIRTRAKISTTFSPTTTEPQILTTPEEVEDVMFMSTSVEPPVSTTTTANALTRPPSSAKAVNAAISLLAHAPSANLSSQFSAIFRQKLMTQLIRLQGYTDTHRHCRGGAINMDPVLDLVACQQLCDAAGDSCGGITVSLRDSRTCFAKSSGCTLTSGRSESWTFLRKDSLRNKNNLEKHAEQIASSSTQSTILMTSPVPVTSETLQKTTSHTRPSSTSTTPNLLLPVRPSSPFASLSFRVGSEASPDHDNKPIVENNVKFHHSVNNDVADDFASIFKFEDASQHRHPPSPPPASLASLIAKTIAGNSANNVISNNGWTLTTKSVPIPHLPTDIQRSWAGFGSSDFADIHQHCKGGSLENALVYFSVDRCKAACRNEPTCVGISISLGGSGFCFLKNASCQLSGASDDWTFLRRQS